MGTNGTPAEIMANKPMSGAEMAQDVEQRLFEAGITLSCLPSHGLKPSSRVSSWRDTLMDLDDLLTLVADEDLRPPVPSASKISRMDEAMGWVQAISAADQRRVVLLWMMIHPITHRHRLSWEKIGKRIGRSDKTAKSLFHRGLASITKKIYA